MTTKNRNKAFKTIRGHYVHKQVPLRGKPRSAMSVLTFLRQQNRALRFHRSESMFEPKDGHPWQEGEGYAQEVILDKDTHKISSIKKHQRMSRNTLNNSVNDEIIPATLRTHLRTKHIRLFDTTAHTSNTHMGSILHDALIYPSLATGILGIAKGDDLLRFDKHLVFTAPFMGFNGETLILDIDELIRVNGENSVYFKFFDWGYLNLHRNDLQITPQIKLSFIFNFPDVTITFQHVDGKQIEIPLPITDTVYHGWTGLNDYLAKYLFVMIDRIPDRDAGFKKAIMDYFNVLAEKDALAEHIQNVMRLFLFRCELDFVNQIKLSFMSIKELRHKDDIICDLVSLRHKISQDDVAYVSKYALPENIKTSPFILQGMLDYAEKHQAKAVVALLKRQYRETIATAHYAEIMHRATYAYEHHLRHAYQESNLYSSDVVYKADNIIIQRPNHGLAHSLRVACYAENVVDYFATYAKDEGYRQFCQNLTSQQLLAMQTALLFSVTGRESDLGFFDDPEAYTRYRIASAQQFEDFAINYTDMTINDIAKYKEIVRYLGDPTYAALKDEQAHEKQYIYHIMNLARTLDLPRCFDRKKSHHVINDIFEDLSTISDHQQTAGNRLIDMAAQCILKTGDRLIEPRTHYKTNTFYEASTNPEFCLKAIKQAMEYCNMPTNLPDALLSTVSPDAAMVDVTEHLQHLSHDEKIQYLYLNSNAIKHVHHLVAALSHIRIEDRLKVAHMFRHLLVDISALASVLELLSDEDKPKFTYTMAHLIVDCENMGTILTLMPKNEHVRFIETHKDKIKKVKDILKILEIVARVQPEAQLETMHIIVNKLAQDKPDLPSLQEYLIKIYRSLNQRNKEDFISIIATYFSHNIDDIRILMLATRPEDGLTIVAKSGLTIDNINQALKVMLSLSSPYQIPFLSQHLSLIQNGSNLLTVMKVLPEESQKELLTQLENRILQQDFIASLHGMDMAEIELLAKGLQEPARLSFLTKLKPLYDDIQTCAPLFSFVSEENVMKLVHVYQDFIQDLGDILTITPHLSTTESEALLSEYDYMLKNEDHLLKILTFIQLSDPFDFIERHVHLIVSGSGLGRMLAFIDNSHHMTVVDKLMHKLIRNGQAESINKIHFQKIGEALDADNRLLFMRTYGKYLDKKDIAVYAAVIASLTALKDRFVVITASNIVLDDFSKLTKLVAIIDQKDQLAFMNNHFELITTINQIVELTKLLGSDVSSQLDIANTNVSVEDHKSKLRQLANERASKMKSPHSENSIFRERSDHPPSTPGYEPPSHKT